MQAPAIAPGTIEQALYTWSSVNLDSGRGRGFGSASYGLAACLGWLQAVTKDRFNLNDRLAKGQEVEPYEGWQQFVATGSVRAGELNVVYRKVADAGLDGAQRPRFVVHVLVGRADELDLATVGGTGRPWLEASECPLDRLPTLAALKREELPPPQAAYAGVSLDAAAQALLERMVAAKTGLSLDVSPQASLTDTTTELLAALPTALWPCVELDWRVGAQGPVGRVHVSHDVGPHEPAPRRASAIDCPTHRSVERVWEELERSERTWLGFAANFERLERQRTARERLVQEQAAQKPAPAAPKRATPAQPAKRKAASRPKPPAQPKPTSTPPPPATAAAASASAASAVSAGSPQRRAAAAIVAAVGDSSWSPAHALDDNEARLAFSALEDLPRPAGGWLAALDHETLASLLGEASTGTAFVRAERFFSVTDVSTAELAAAWRETSLAAVGFALLRRPAAERPEKRWAVPKRIELTQLRRLVEHLVAIDSGHDRISLLFGGGFGESTAARPQLMRALKAANTPPHLLYGKILPNADLPPKVLFEILRDDPDTFASCLNVTHPIAEALRYGLTRRSLPRRMLGLAHEG